MISQVIDVLERDAVEEADRIDRTLALRRMHWKERRAMRCQAEGCTIRPRRPGERLCAVHTFEIRRRAAR